VGGGVVGGGGLAADGFASAYGEGFKFGVFKDAEPQVPRAA
jgi:hypothetical protein